jgi:signal transduction histidine kinase
MYEEASKMAHTATATEISRLYSASEQKVMQYAAEVSRANRELARLEKAKTDFISIAAHELKTPLTLIQGYVDILEELKVNERVDGLVRRINRGTERMNLILNDMLDLTAIDTGQLNLVIEPVNLKAILELVITQAGRILRERGQTFRTQGLDMLPLIEADGQRLHQVFKQIINNAIKYTPDGGQIVIAAQEINEAAQPGPCLKITVRDTGIGIAPEDRDKVFDKFYRVGDSNLHSTGQSKFRGAGPGLGLAIAKGLIEAHGGQIWVESPGFDLQNTPGSTFYVVLPVKVKGN